MGYILKDIADITEPARVSLSGLPNFIQIASKTSGGSKYQIRLNPSDASAIVIEVRDSSGGARTFQGVTDPDKVEGSLFYISADAMETAENLKNAMLNDAYLSANFEIFSDIKWSDGAAVIDGVLVTAKDIGGEFNLTVTASGASASQISTGSKSDSLSGDDATVEVSADLYRLGAVRYIHTAAPSGSLGEAIVTLSKTYSGAPVWFDLNGVAAQNLNFTPIVSAGWFNTGTVSAFRALIRKGNFSQTPIFITEVLYALSGFGSLIQDRELLPLAFVSGAVRTLTDRPETPYVKGQREYLNFLLGSPLEGKVIALTLKAYDGKGGFMGAKDVHAIDAANLHAINSCAFTFSDLLDEHPTAARLTATVTLGGAAITTPQSYTVRPECLHVTNDIHFLNRYGGWDTFNFDAPTSEESKPVSETFSRTVTPSYDGSVGVEGVHHADLESNFTIQGSPIGESAAEWLKQLSASKVALNSDGLRIIIESFTLKSAKGEYQTPILKYRLSETFTNGY